MARKKRARKKEFRTTLKLPDDVTNLARSIEERTGWGFGAAVAFLCRTGGNGLFGGSGQPDQVAAIRAAANVYHAAVDAHDAQRVADRLAAEGRAKLNAAKKAMQAAALPPVIPELPPGGAGEPAQGPRRRRGRPRKHSAIPPVLTGRRVSGHSTIDLANGILAAELAEKPAGTAGKAVGGSDSHT